PMIFAGISVAVNVALALALFPRIAEAGIAAAEAGAGWLNATLLLTTLVRRGHWEGDAGLLRRLPRLAFCAVVMALGLEFTIGLADPFLRPQSPVFVQVPALGCLIAGAMVLYFGLAFAIGGADIGMIRRSLDRDRAARREARDGKP